MSAKRHNFFANWQAKIICFLLALATVFVVTYGLQQKREVKLPLEVNLPANGYKAVSLIPTEVTLVIQGTEDKIYMVNADNFSLSADFTNVSHEGVCSVPVNIQFNGSSDALDFSQITLYTDPATVRIYFEKQ